MSDFLSQMSCVDFVHAVAAKKSVPGGGSVAALVGALGASLGAMSARFTLGKPAFASHDERLRELIEKTDELAAGLMYQVDLDVRAVELLMGAWGLPKGDSNRALQIQAATRGACTAPLAIMELSCTTIELLEELSNKCSAMLLSDVGCAAFLCEAALQAASLNVYVNTVYLADQQQRTELENTCNELCEQWIPRAQALAHTIQKRIRKEN